MPVRDDFIRYPKVPVLRFTPYAWAKLIFLRDHVDTEIGGMAVCSRYNPLLVQDIAVIKQEVGIAAVHFNEVAYGKWATEMCDPEGQYRLPPVSCQRVWIHTHPGSSPTPSGTDEATFRDAFGCSDWSVMFIMAKQGQTYARMQISGEGPMRQFMVPVEVDWTAEFAGSDIEAWKQEVKCNVAPLSPVTRRPDPVEAREYSNTELRRREVIVTPPPSEQPTTTVATGSGLSRRDRRLINKEAKEAATRTRELREKFGRIQMFIGDVGRGEFGIRSLRLSPVAKLSWLWRAAFSTARPLTPTAMKPHFKPEHFEELLKLGITTDYAAKVKASPLTVVLFSFADTKGTVVSTASNRLVEMLPPFHREHTSGFLGDQIQLVENILKDAACGRDFDSLKGTRDVFGNPFKVSPFPWICFDNKILWLSTEEKDVMSDVVNGGITAHQFAEMLDLGPIGDTPQDKSIIIIGPNTRSDSNSVVAASEDPDDGSTLTDDDIGHALDETDKIEPVSEQERLELNRSRKDADKEPPILGPGSYQTRSSDLLLDRKERMTSAFIEIIQILKDCKDAGDNVDSIEKDLRVRALTLRSRTWYEEYLALCAKASQVGYNPDTFQERFAEFTSGPVPDVPAGTGEDDVNYYN